MWRLLILLASISLAKGDVIHLHFASPFTPHAVLQRGVEVQVWGTANPGLEFEVQFGGQTIAAKADAKGNWQVALAPMEASDVGRKLSISTGRAGRSIDDILVGEVWYASGQSNMDMRLEACAKRLPAIAEVMESERVLPIRILEINEPDSPDPLDQLENPANWKTDGELNRGRFSALAYLFARQLHDELKGLRVKGHNTGREKHSQEEGIPRIAAMMEPPRCLYTIPYGSRACNGVEYDGGVEGTEKLVSGLAALRYDDKNRLDGHVADSVIALWMAENAARRAKAGRAQYISTGGLFR